MSDHPNSTDKGDGDQMPGDPTLEMLLAGSDHSATDDRLLDTALELFSLVGIKRTSTDDIARRAGINRVTLYRRLGAKDQIVRTVLLREVSRALAHIQAETAAVQGFAEQITRGFVVTVTLSREHSLLRQAIAVDREDTFTWLTHRAGPALDLGITFIADQIQRARTDNGLPPVQDATALQALAAILVRFTHSLVLTPDAPPRLDTPQQLHTFANDHIRPLIANLT